MSVISGLSKALSFVIFPAVSTVTPYLLTPSNSLAKKYASLPIDLEYTGTGDSEDEFPNNDNETQGGIGAFEFEIMSESDWLAETASTPIEKDKNKKIKVRKDVNSSSHKDIYIIAKVESLTDLAKIPPVDDADLPLPNGISEDVVVNDSLDLYVDSKKLFLCSLIGDTKETIDKDEGCQIFELNTRKTDHIIDLQGAKNNQTTIKTKNNLSKGKFVLVALNKDIYVNLTKSNTKTSSINTTNDYLTEIASLSLVHAVRESEPNSTNLDVAESNLFLLDIVNKTLLQLS